MLNRPAPTSNTRCAFIGGPPAFLMGATVARLQCASESPLHCRRLPAAAPSSGGSRRSQPPIPPNQGPKNNELNEKRDHFGSNRADGNPPRPSLEAERCCDVDVDGAERDHESCPCITTGCYHAFRHILIDYRRQVSAEPAAPQHDRRDRKI